MPSIKDLKSRITSVKNTQQTTKAMKMVSAAKLRRATDAILSQRPYAQEIARMMRMVADPGHGDVATGSRQPVSLLVVFSSDRGLCGAYNGSVTRAALAYLSEKKRQGRAVKVMFVGKKAMELVKSRMSVDQLHFEEFGAKVTFRKASDLSKRAIEVYHRGEVDEITVIYNEFKNAISQEVRTQTVFPIGADQGVQAGGALDASRDLAIHEPSKAELYEALAAKYFVVQIFKACLEAQASEHGARMSAMENATRNAGDMIRRLTLQYNKQRQAAITKELLEIIAGSESQKVQA
jgi:F-type H+-transporting ATPase subunit gamma